MQEAVAGFDWDSGNQDKCLRHGVTIAEIESVFERDVMVFPDSEHSADEVRYRAVGETAEGRKVFLVFTLRDRDGARLIRPISARYMHQKEIDHYEKENPGL